MQPQYMNGMPMQMPGNMAMVNMGMQPGQAPPTEQVPAGANNP